MVNRFITIYSVLFRFAAHSKIPLRKINKWQQYGCRESWKELRILANAISEVSSLKENDRVGFVNLVDKYKKYYKFPNEIIREFEKSYDYWRNLAIVETLLEIKENLLEIEKIFFDAVSFDKFNTELERLIKTIEFFEQDIDIKDIIKKIKNILNVKKNDQQKKQFIISQYLDWNINYRTINYWRFTVNRDRWKHLLDESWQNIQDDTKSGYWFQSEYDYLFQVIDKLPLFINPTEGTKFVINALAQYYSINGNNEQWLTATEKFRRNIFNFVETLQKQCPVYLKKWLKNNNPNITINGAISLVKVDRNVKHLPENHPLHPMIFQNIESITKDNEFPIDECRRQCLQAVKESIKKYTISDDEFHEIRSGFISLLQKHRNQLEAKVNEIQKELLSSGFLQRQITAEEIEKLRNKLDKYQSIVNQIVYPHKEDHKVINDIKIPQPLVKACGVDLENQKKKQKDINTLKQEIEILPTEEQKNLEQWSQFTEKAKRYSPKYALSYALQETIPKTTLEQAFNLSEKEPEKQSIWTRDVRTLIPEVFRKSETINLEENIGTLLKQGTIIVPLLRLPESDLTKVVKVLSQDKDNLPIKFNEQTHPVEEQILILIGADVIPALNYINQINNNTMANLQTKIFSDLEQDDIIQLESSLNQIFRNIDSIKAKKSLLSNGGINNYFIDALDFNLGISEFITNLVAKFKEYKVSSQKLNYHPLISFLEYVIKEPEKYNLDDQDLEIFNKIITFGKQKIQALSTQNSTSKTNLIISQIGNSEPVIGIITALEKEYVAVKAVFEQGRDVMKSGQGAGRRYWLTDIAHSQGTPQTVAVTLADMGNNAATFRASNMLHHYPNVKSIIMCGIAGGVPHPTKVEDHVRLGDIVVSNKKGIVQYDFDKESQEFTEIRAMPVAASAELIEAARYLRSNEMLGQRPWEDVILKALQKLNWQRPSQETDLLYSSEETDEIIPHPEDSERQEDQPKIFLGAIGSANKLLKNPQKRDLLRDQFGIKAIEMEGSGVADATWNHGIGYLVVRGICDYCDVHKSDDWQKYSAVTAAAYVRTLLSSM